MEEKGEVSDSPFLQSPRVLPWTQGTILRLTTAGDYVHLPAEVMSGTVQALDASEIITVISNGSAQIRNYHKPARACSAPNPQEKKSSILNFLHKCFQVLRFYEQKNSDDTNTKAKKYVCCCMCSSLSFASRVTNPKAPSYRAKNK